MRLATQPASLVAASRLTFDRGSSISRNILFYNNAVRISIRSFGHDGPAFVLRRNPHKFTNLHTPDGKKTFPTSYVPLFPNKFVHRSPEEHREAYANGPKLGRGKGEADLIVPQADNHHMFEWRRAFNYSHMSGLSEPTLPRAPSVQHGELAAGANVVRTTVWNQSDKPAIEAIKEFHPDWFRPRGYAESVPSPASTTPDGAHDFREYRLKPGHASRKPFLYLMSAGSVMMVAGLSRKLVMMFMQFLYISRDFESFGAIEIDTSKIGKGENVTMKWRGKPVFIFRRTPEQIKHSQEEDKDVKGMKDPATDAERCPNPEWLVCMGACTHLGCIPIFGSGNYHGYFCPCHGSHYDLAGRIRQGPAPLNLPLPEYQWIDESTIKVG